MNSPFEGQAGVRWTAVATLDGGRPRLLASKAQLAPKVEALFSVLGELSGMGGALGLSGLDLLEVRGVGHTLVVALRSEAMLLAEVDGRLPPPLEGEVEAWLAAEPEQRWEEASPRASGGAESVSVFAGQLGVFSVPDLLDFLRNGRRTGELVLTNGSAVGQLLFCDGRITHSRAPAMPSAIDLLVEIGELAQLDASALKANLEAERDPVGTLRALLMQGLITREGLERALHRQTALAIREFKRWAEGKFAFSRVGAGQAVPDEGVVTVDPQAILLDLFREEDEAGPHPRGGDA